MEGFKVKQELGKYYIVVESFLDEEESYLASMITENIIKGHLQCRKSFENNREIFLFDVTNMVSLDKEYENRFMGFEDLKAIFESIYETYMAGSVHLLEEQYYVIDPAYIFRDMETEEIKLLYAPGLKQNNRYSRLADFLLQKVNRKDESCLQTAYQFYRMSGSEMFSISMFLNIIKKEQILLKKSVPKIEIEPAIEETVLKDDVCEESIKALKKPWVISGITIVLFGSYYFVFRSSIYAMYILVIAALITIISIFCWIKVAYEFIKRKDEEDIVIPDIPVTVEDYWGDSDNSDYDEETVILNSVASSSGMKIQWTENNTDKEYEVKSFPVIIGKLDGEVDCKINDTSVSRLHAKIIKREGELFIFDLNSTNGTNVNGSRLRPGEEIQIDYNSRIVLGQVSLSLVC